MEVGKQYGFGIYTPENSENYYNVIRKIDFNVLEKVVEDDNKVDTDTGIEYEMVTLSIIMLVAATFAVCILAKKKKSAMD